MVISGIYKILNKANGRYYIGSSKHIKKRWDFHKYYLRKNTHCNTHLQNAWNEYGENMFEFIIQEQCDVDSLLPLEQKYLDSIKQNQSSAYNMNFKATGCEFTAETIAKMKKNRIGAGNSFYGKHHTEETKKKIGGAVVDYSGKKNPFHGKKHSEDVKKKLSDMKKKLVKDKHPQYDHSIFEFKNTKTNEEFVGTKFNFCAHFNLSMSNVYRMIKGRNKSVKNWTLKKAHCQ